MQTFDPILYIFEAEFASERDYSDPIRDVTVVATFAGPQGEERSVEAFWDGNRTWRVRFSPPFPGEWGYKTACSETGDAGLHRQNGRFTAGAYTGDHPLLRHGSIRRSEDNLSLAHADGTPFFWMADTAWNGVLKAEPAGWDLYLATRKDQGFSAIQAVISPWRSCPTNAAGEAAFTGTESIEINPAFYPGIDANIKAIAAHGLVPSPVMIWACTPGDPGYFLPAEDLTRLARCEVARYAAYRPIWILGGDGEYRGQSAEKWRVTGRAVFGDAGDQPVTMHPQGTNWPGEELRDEPWLTFHSYQSGHGDNDRDLRWLQTGPPATQWMTEPLKPVINQEPNYEGHISYHKKQVFDAYHVRRALYWSLLGRASGAGRSGDMVLLGDRRLMQRCPLHSGSPVAVGQRAGCGRYLPSLRAPTTIVSETHASFEDRLPGSIPVRGAVKPKLRPSS